jgi:DNA-binding transcriptional ArsR family regulator
MRGRSDLASAHPRPRNDHRRTPRLAAPDSIRRMGSSSRREDALVGALSHPTRRKVLRILNARVASPSEMAEEMRQPLGTVSHHVRWLASHQCIELVSTAQRRGAVEHYYRATTHPLLTDEQWQGLSSARRASLAEVMLRDLWRDVLDAKEVDTLTEDDVHLSRTLLLLDDHGHQQLSDMLLEVLRKALEIEAESTRRLGGATGRRTELGLLHFERAP